MQSGDRAKTDVRSCTAEHGGRKTYVVVGRRSYLMSGFAQGPEVSITAILVRSRISLTHSHLRIEKSGPVGVNLVENTSGHSCTRMLLCAPAAPAPGNRSRRAEVVREDSASKPPEDFQNSIRIPKAPRNTTATAETLSEPPQHFRSTQTPACVLSRARARATGAGGRGEGRRGHRGGQARARRGLVRGATNRS